MEENNEDRKRPYESPRMEVVKLIAEEAMLVGCKIGGTNGPLSGGNNCRLKGSPCVSQAT